MELTFPKNENIMLCLNLLGWEGGGLVWGFWGFFWVGGLFSGGMGGGVCLGRDVCKLDLLYRVFFWKKKKIQEGLSQTSCATCSPATAISSSSTFRTAGKYGNMLVISGCYCGSNETASSFTRIMQEREIKH